jgi:hypothetical protein
VGKTSSTGIGGGHSHGTSYVFLRFLWGWEISIDLVGNKAFSSKITLTIIENQCGVQLYINNFTLDYIVLLPIANSRVNAWLNASTF